LHLKPKYELFLFAAALSATNCLRQFMDSSRINVNENDSRFNFKAIMIVCVCNNISDREIRQAADLGLATVAELRRDLGVGTCCGKCVSCARAVLHAHQERSAAAGPMAATALSFRRTEPA
jgi:bacterioferritin-associated ferredoxin